MTSALAPMLFYEPTSNPNSSTVPFVNAVPKSGILLNPYPPNHSPTTTTNLITPATGGNSTLFGRSPRVHAATLPASSEDHSLSTANGNNSNTLSPASAGGGGNGRWSAKSSPLAKSVTLPLSRNDSSSSSKSDLNNSNNNGSHSRANSMRKIRFAPLPDPRKLEELELVMDSPLGLIPTSLAVSALSTSPSKSNGVLGEEMSPRSASAVVDQDPATPASQVSQFSSVSASTANTVDSSATAPAATTRSSMSGGGAPSVCSTDDGRAETDTDSRHRKSKSWSKRIFRPLLLKSTSTSAPSTPNPANASHQGYSSDGLWRTTSRDSVTSNTSNDSGAFGLTRWGTSTGFADRFVPRTSGVPLGRTQSLGTTSAPQAKSHPLPKKKPGHAASSSLGGAGRRNQRMLNGRVYGYRQSNPFANVQDNEPEFVEWGHGGAGSVRSNNSTGSSMYAGVQSAGRVSIGHTGQGAGTGAANSGGGGGGEDEDDGSGVAWLRKRREARERERREKEAAEAKAKEDAAKTDVDPTAGKETTDTTATTSADNAKSAAAGGDKPGTNGDSSEDKVQEGIEVDRNVAVPPSSEHGPTVPSAIAEPSSVTAVPEDKQQQHEASHERAMMMGGGGSMTPIMEVDVASPASSKDGAGTPLMAKEEHHVTAVTVPVAHHHHHHHHHHHKPDTSGDATPNITTTTTTTTTMVPDSNASTASTVSSSSSSTSSSSRGGEGDGESDETEDEDATDSGTSEEEEDEESGEDTEGESRVTSRCAGVEKVSRHKEQC